MGISEIEAKEALKQIHRKYPSGGPLHVVIGDGNYETGFIVWCLVNAVPKVEKHDRELFMKLAEYMLDLPERKRSSIWEGIEPNAPN